MTSKTCLNVNWLKSLCKSPTYFLLIWLFIEYSSSGKKFKFPLFKGPLHMGHGPVIFPGRRPLPIGLNPEVSHHTPNTPKRVHFRHGGVIHPHHGPVSPIRPHFGSRPALHRHEPVMSVWVHLQPSSCLGKSLMACNIAMLVSTLNLTTCLNGTSRMLNLSKLDFMLIWLFTERLL